MIVKFEVEMTEEEFKKMIGGMSRVIVKEKSVRNRGPNKNVGIIDDRIVAEAGEGATPGVIFNRVKSGSFSMFEFLVVLQKLVEEGRVKKVPLGKKYAGKELFKYVGNFA